MSYNKYVISECLITTTDINVLPSILLLYTWLDYLSICYFYMLLMLTNDFSFIFWLLKNRLLNEEDPTIILFIICSYILKKENWKNSIQYQSYECLKNVSDFNIVQNLFITTTTATLLGSFSFCFFSNLSQELSGIVIYALYTILLIYLMYCPL